eukprot:15497971-Heterocapsa_arctica.AAC.1
MHRVRLSKEVCIHLQKLAIPDWVCSNEVAEHIFSDQAELPESIDMFDILGPINANDPSANKVCDLASQIIGCIAKRCDGDVTILMQVLGRVVLQAPDHCIAASMRFALIAKDPFKHPVEDASSFVWIEIVDRASQSEPPSHESHEGRVVKAIKGEELDLDASSTEVDKRGHEVDSCCHEVAMSLALAHAEWLANHDDQGLCPTWPSLSDQSPLQTELMSNSSMIVNTNMRPDGFVAVGGDSGTPAIGRVHTQHCSIRAVPD